MNRERREVLQILLNHFDCHAFRRADTETSCRASGSRYRLVHKPPERREFTGKHCGGDLFKTRLDRSGNGRDSHSFVPAHVRVCPAHRLVTLLRKRHGIDGDSSRCHSDERIRDGPSRRIESTGHHVFTLGRINHPVRDLLQVVRNVDCLHLRFDERRRLCAYLFGGCGFLTHPRRECRRAGWIACRREPCVESLQIALNRRRVTVYTRALIREGLKLSERRPVDCADCIRRDRLHPTGEVLREFLSRSFCVTIARARDNCRNHKVTVFFRNLHKPLCEVSKIHRAGNLPPCFRAHCRESTRKRRARPLLIRGSTLHCLAQILDSLRDDLAVRGNPRICRRCGFLKFC